MPARSAGFMPGILADSALCQNAYRLFNATLKKCHPEKHERRLRGEQRRPAFRSPTAES
jgi:hypothetical protein